ncbi:MAG: RidA family protein [Gammaproteobacteria bacterium]|nr:RidA family protein [Gammaproteobacteria bacterium]
MLGTAFAQEHTREYVIDDRGRQRAFSRAVATTGGKIIWLAGQTTTTDANGNSLAGDFEGQTREIFRILDERLRGFGGDLSDIVTMTVYISDTRFGDPFVDIRSEHFDNDEYPSSALITVVGFARPDILIEIKATAVVDAD